MPKIWDLISFLAEFRAWRLFKGSSGSVRRPTTVFAWPHFDGEGNVFAR